jgi:hypothetical protein
VATKKTRREKDRMRAESDWNVARHPQIVRSSRQLDAEERDRIWRALTDTWGMRDFGWSPRAEGRRAPYGVATFSAAAFDPEQDDNICELLRMALVTRGVSRI